MHNSIKDFENRVRLMSTEPISFFVATTPLNKNELSETEHMAFVKTPNKNQFLISRRALKQAMSFLGMGEDTSCVSFPHPHVSLTHSHSIGIVAVRPHTAGIGVDLEKIRPLNERHAALFLSPAECKEYMCSSSEKLTELWTIKEAAYKADEDQAGFALKDYEIFYGDRIVKKQKISLRFLTEKVGDFFLSVCYKEI